MKTIARHPVQLDGSSSDFFPVRSRAKQDDCVLASTQFCIFSRRCCLSDSQRTECIFLQTGLPSCQNQSVTGSCTRDALRRRDAALTTHFEKALQLLIITASLMRVVWLDYQPLKKNNILSQDVSSSLSISIDDLTLEVVEDFTYTSAPPSPVTPSRKPNSKQQKPEPAWHEDLRQPHADQQQEAGVPSLCAQYSALWQRVVVSLFSPISQAYHL